MLSHGSVVHFLYAFYSILGTQHSLHFLSLIVGHLDCFEVLAFVNKPTVTILVQDICFHLPWINT